MTVTSHRKKCQAPCTPIMILLLVVDAVGRSATVEWHGLKMEGRAHRKEVEGHSETRVSVLGGLLLRRPA